MSKIAKSAIGLMIATLLAKILGFGRELVLGSAYGISSYTDAYVVAYNIPITAFAIIGTGLATTFIPIFNEVDKELGKNKANKFTSNVINIVLILCTIVAILGVVFTDELVKLFASGFNEETLSIAVEFTRITIMGVAFMGINQIMTSYLQIKGNFIVPGLISLPQNIIIIISIILSLKYGTSLLAYGILLATVGQVIMQLPFVLKNDYKYKLHIDAKDKYIKEMMILLGPVLVGVTMSQVNGIIDRNLASALSTGSVAALNYANKLNGFVIGMFIFSISAVVYPIFSKMFNQNNIEEFNKTLSRTLNSIIILIVPITVGAITLATPIVKVLFERGEFDSRATIMTATALSCYAVGMLGIGVYEILTKAFYSIKDTKTPLIVGTFIGVPINIVLNLILVKYLGHSGLALATSIATLTYTAIAFVVLGKKIGDFNQNQIIKTLLKTILCALIMGILTTITYNGMIHFLGDGKLSIMISLVISVLVGIITYFFTVRASKIEEIDFMLDVIKSKLKSIKFFKQ